MQGRLIKSDLIWRSNLQSSCVCAFVCVNAWVCARQRYIQSNLHPNQILLFQIPVCFVPARCLSLNLHLGTGRIVHCKRKRFKALSLFYRWRQRDKPKTHRWRTTWAARVPFPVELQRAYCGTSADRVIIVRSGKWTASLRACWHEHFHFRKSWTITCSNQQRKGKKKKNHFLKEGNEINTESWKHRTLLGS